MAKRPQVGVYGVDFAQQENTVLADLLNVQLAQTQCDVQDQLVNNDYEGEFFDEGDTVKIVAIDPNSIKVEARNFKNSMRPMLDELQFSQATMTINKSLAYGFKIKDLSRIEDRWNHESAATAIAARKMRETHNLLTLDLILKNTNIPCIGSPSSPIALTAGNEGEDLFKIVNFAKSHLKTAGAIDASSHYTYGANKTTPVRATASLFLAPELYTVLLNSQYKRVDDVSEDVIKAGKYEKFAGFILNEAPELSVNSLVHASQLDVIKTTYSKDVAVMIIGTKNLVTRASKVLPPEKMRDQVERADKYDGVEIYGEMVAVPQAAVIVFCEIPSITIGGSALSIGQNTYVGGVKDADTLMLQYQEQLPYINIADETTLDNSVTPAFGSQGQPGVAGGYPANTGYIGVDSVSNDTFEGHIHTFDVSGDAETGVETSTPTEPNNP